MAVALQAALAILVLKVPIVKDGFNAAEVLVVSFISFSDNGGELLTGICCLGARLCSALRGRETWRPFPFVLARPLP